jgi:hypothetical protein
MVVTCHILQVRHRAGLPILCSPFNGVGGYAVENPLKIRCIIGLAACAGRYRVADAK